MTSLDTLGHGKKRKMFSYKGSVASGVKVLFRSQTATIDAAFLRAALRHFAGRRIPGGLGVGEQWNGKPG